MKLVNKISAVALIGAIFFASCDKAYQDANYVDGSAPVLTADKTGIALNATDSTTIALRLDWTSPKYDGDANTFKYVIEIDSTGKNFLSPMKQTITQMGKRNLSFLAKDLNALFLDKFGGVFNMPSEVDIRVISSLSNNSLLKTSNVWKLKYTPYKIPPKVPLPTTNRLFIVGSATAGGWSNPVPVPSQELARIDETTWGGIFNFNANGNYLLLPTNGSWAAKYSVASGTTNGTTGSFGFNLPQDFPGPAAGWARLTVDFQKGIYTVTPLPSNENLPNNLFIVGNATPGGWNNPVPVPSQQFTRLNNSEFVMNSLALSSGAYLLLPVNGDWSAKYAVPDNSIPSARLGGKFIANTGQDFPAPTVAGNYKIEVNFFTYTYKLTKL